MCRHCAKARHIHGLTLTPQHWAPLARLRVEDGETGGTVSGFQGADIL